MKLFPDNGLEQELSMGNGGADSATPTWLQRAIIGRNPSFTIARIVILVATCTVVFRFVLLPIRVEGVSMLPTYKNHGIHFINRFAYLSRPPQRGDVVGIRYTGIHVMLMKRIVGLPGETLAFHAGHLFINGQLVEEPYVKSSCDWEIPPETIGPDEYYVVGDNRSMPEADHTKGRAQLSRVIGKVVL